MQFGSRAVAGQCKHYAYSTEKTYVYWAKRFVLYRITRCPLFVGSEVMRAGEMPCRPGLLRCPLT